MQPPLPPELHADLQDHLEAARDKLLHPPHHLTHQQHPHHHPPLGGVGASASLSRPSTAATGRSGRHEPEPAKARVDILRLD